ncbi:MAG: glutamate--tRNA ligase [bacterium]|nr:glutamate--tRNA ligase [bacterium]
MTVRVRIAPSPTGPLHIGTARTALFNYLFAKNQKGVFILRIEDTDKKRSEKRFEIEIKEALAWLGISWDEEVIQSERIDIHKKYLQKLVKEKKIFWCPHTQEQLSLEREKQMQERQAPRHICEYRNGEKNEDQQGILRFKNDAAGELVFEDLIRGTVTSTPSLLGDFSVAKNFEEPLYNFVVTVDDADMRITHIIRGEDHIPNTPKQILIQNALGFERPQYAHLPLVLGEDRSKLSKRHGATAVTQYKKEGYFAPALVNFLALLGWHPKQTKGGSEEDIFSLEELIPLFSLSDIQKGGAVFDIKKLQWINGVYIRAMDKEKLAETLFPYLKQGWQNYAVVRPGWWQSIASLEQTRLVTFKDIIERVDYFFEDPVVRKEVLLEKGGSAEDTKAHLEAILKKIEPMQKGSFTGGSLHEKILPYAETHGKKSVLWPFRVALTGKSASAGLFEVAEIIGKEQTEKRLHHAIAVLS